MRRPCTEAFPRTSRCTRLTDRPRRVQEAKKRTLALARDVLKWLPRVRFPSFLMPLFSFSDASKRLAHACEAMLSPKLV